LIDIDGRNAKLIQEYIEFIFAIWEAKFKLAEQGMMPAFQDSKAC
jgi:hypothetical protein